MTVRKAFLTPLAVVLVIAAFAAPAASAYTEPAFPGGGPAQPAKVRVVEVPSNSGFQWGDAAIGAGTALAIGLVGLGGALAMSGLRNRHAVGYRGATPSAP